MEDNNRIHEDSIDQINNKWSEKLEFNEQSHKRDILNIENKIAEDKKADETKIEELKSRLSTEENSIPINDFIIQEKENWINNGKELVIRLIKKWYNWDEIISSNIDNSTKSLLEQTKNWIIEKQIIPNKFRFTDKEEPNESEINEWIINILKEYVLTWNSFTEIVSKMPLKRAITMNDIQHWKILLNEMAPTAIYQIKLNWIVLDDFDRSDSKEVFRYITYDNKTFSKTSKEHLPEWYNPLEIFEKWKTIWLWIDEVHKQWYTWEWIWVAICDWQLKTHKDIKTASYTVDDYAKGKNEFFHASAVASILAGKETWVAPNADLHFFAEYQDKSKESWGNGLKLSLEKIYEMNKELPNDKKIRVVSISWPLYWNGTEETAGKLRSTWVWILDSSEFFKNFWYLNKEDPMWDPNNFDNYKHWLGKPEALYVNSWDRTIADPSNETAYRHDPIASASWAIPVVAGYYALACQADSKMTPEKFIKLAKETAYQRETVVWEIEKEYAGIPINIKIIDINKLINKINEEK